MLSTCKHPGNGNLRDHCTLCLRNRAQCLDKREVVIEVGTSETRAESAETARLMCVSLRPMFADKAARDDRYQRNRCQVGAGCRLESSLPRQDEHRCPTSHLRGRACPRT